VSSENGTVGSDELASLSDRVDELDAVEEAEAAARGEAEEPAGSADDDVTEAAETAADADAEVGAEPAEDEVVDPVAEMRDALRRAPGEWYVVHSYAGYENKVKTNLETRIHSLDMEDYIFQVEVPTEEVT